MYPSHHSVREENYRDVEGCPNAGGRNSWSERWRCLWIRTGPELGSASGCRKTLALARWVGTWSQRSGMCPLKKKHPENWMNVSFLGFFEMEGKIFSCYMLSNTPLALLIIYCVPLVSVALLLYQSPLSIRERVVLLSACCAFPKQWDDMSSLPTGSQDAAHDLEIMKKHRVMRNNAAELSWVECI